MSKKNKNNKSNNNVKVSSTQTGDKSREKWGKIASYLLLFVALEMIPCLLFGWIFDSEKSMSDIGDNFVTAFIQNYNYIIVGVCLIPIIAYIYSKIKNELIKREHLLLYHALFLYKMNEHCYLHNLW